MFAVGVVLLVLDRTGSPGLAGLAVAAITFPSLLTGPLLGAWLDLTGRRRRLMVVDQRRERMLVGVAAAGVRQIVAVPALRGITAAAALGMAGLGLLTVAFPLFAVEHLGAARSDAGYMWAAFAAGSTLGALSLVRVQRRFKSQRIVLAGYAIFGALMLLWPLAGSLSAMLALIAVAACADGPHWRRSSRCARKWSRAPSTDRSSPPLRA